MQEHQSAGGLIYNKGKFLLIYRKGKKDFTLPKGHLEGKETPEEAALREVTEETGFQNLEIVADLGEREYFWKEGGVLHHKKEHDFLMKLKDETRKKLSGPEYEDIKNVWLTPKEAPKKASYQSVKETLGKAISKLKAQNAKPQRKT